MGTFQLPQNFILQRWHLLRKEFWWKAQIFDDNPNSNVSGAQSRSKDTVYLTTLPKQALLRLAYGQTVLASIALESAQYPVLMRDDIHSVKEKPCERRCEYIKHTHTDFGERICSPSTFCLLRTGHAPSVSFQSGL